MNFSHRESQDWQYEAFEHQSRVNPVVRYRRTIDEMDNKLNTWGINMSERSANEAQNYYSHG